MKWSVIREEREPQSQAEFEAANHESCKRELEQLRSALVAALHRGDDEEAAQLREIIKGTESELETGHPVLESDMSPEERKDINARIKKLTSYRAEVAKTARRPDAEGKRAKARLIDIDKELDALRDDLNESVDEKTDDKDTLRTKLKQLQADLADLPKNPSNQAGYDALDDLHAKIDAVKKQLGEAADPRQTGQGYTADANGTYVQRFTEIERMLKQINATLGKHSERQQKDAKNWGYAGDLDEVAKKLGEILTFMDGV